MTATVTCVGVERELDRYLTLCAELGPGLSMFSERIDGAWHDRLDDPDAYAARCRDLGFSPVGHVSTPQATRPATLDWVDVYEARWGRLADEWFADVDGVVDDVARRRYAAARSVLPAGCCQDTEWSPAGCCQDTE